MLREVVPGSAPLIGLVALPLPELELFPNSPTIISGCCPVLLKTQRYPAFFLKQPVVLHSVYNRSVSLPSDNNKAVVLCPEMTWLLFRL